MSQCQETQMPSQAITELGTTKHQDGFQLLIRQFFGGMGPLMATVEREKED
jgi:hypothetical protein